MSPSELKNKSASFFMKKGFPRPYNEVFRVPVPYTALSIEDIANVSEERNDECIAEGLCAVCGEPLGETCRIVLTTTSNNANWSDSGIAHPKCSRIVELKCPAFAENNSHFYSDELDTDLTLYNFRRMRKAARPTVTTIPFKEIIAPREHNSTAEDHD